MAVRITFSWDIDVLMISKYHINETRVSLQEIRPLRRRVAYGRKRKKAGTSAGYVGGVEAQTASAVNMLKFLYCGFTGLLLIAGGLLIRLYTFENQLPQIEKDLEERKVQKMEK